MRQPTKEQIRQARRADLYSFLQQNHSDLFDLLSGSLRYKSNKSISIKRGYSGYYDFATGESGNCIDFLTKHLDYRFDEAVIALTGNCISNATMTPAKDNTDNVKEFVLPKQNSAPYKKLYAYLNSRGIANDTIDMLVQTKLIYQDVHNNIVFANHERDWGELRGTNTYSDNKCIHNISCTDYIQAEHNWCSNMNTCERYRNNAFKGMIANSRQDGYWWFNPYSEVADIAYICESSIDAISLYELHRFNNIKENAIYTSIGGVAKQMTIDRISNKYKVILAVDNDDAGELCRQRNLDLDYIVPKNKDWNEDLMQLLKDKNDIC